MWLICCNFCLGAGNAFSHAAQVQLNNLQNKHEAATHYIDAANAYKKSDNEGTYFLVCLKIINCVLEEYIHSN